MKSEEVTKRILVEFPDAMVKAIRKRVKEASRPCKGATLNAFVRYACGHALGESFEGEKFPILSSGGRRPNAGRKPSKPAVRASAETVGSRSRSTSAKSRTSAQ